MFGNPILPPHGHANISCQKYRDAVQKDQIKRQTMELKLQEDFGDNMKERFQLNKAEIENPTVSDSEDSLCRTEE